jgi:hypothetical protein
MSVEKGLEQQESILKSNGLKAEKQLLSHLDRVCKTRQF